MCHFDYCKFSFCGHSTIECHQFCDKAIWNAGRTGTLKLCMPDILERSPDWFGPDEDEPPKSFSFTGLTGSCPVCIDEFKVSGRNSPYGLSLHSPPCHSFLGIHERKIMLATSSSVICPALSIRRMPHHT